MRISRIVTVLAIVVVGVAFVHMRRPAEAQTRPTYVAPRTADGKPDLSGFWQALNNAHYDLEGHVAKAGPISALGAVGAVPADFGVVDGGEIPYQSWAATKKKENEQNWLMLDPVVKCYMPGIPRATYMPFPFQIVQTADAIVMAYAFPSASRTIPLNRKEPAPADFWMGWSQGHWESDTLVVDVTGFNDRTWFDRAGNFHSDELHVVERYRRTGPDHLLYEVTIEDPKVFSRPWKISMPLYRRIEKNMQLLEFNCIPFVEDLMYGHLRRKPAGTP
jgi:hypothetical protein